MKNTNTTTILLLLLLLFLILTVTVTAKTTVSDPVSPVSAKRHERATTMRRGSSTTTGEAKFEIDGYSKVCWTRGPCFKKKLVCPKKCSKLPGEGGAADGGDRRRLVKNHFPGQCVFNCKKCIAHC